MSINIALMISDHAEKVLTDLDNEIKATTERLARLHYERMRAEAHLALENVFMYNHDRVE
jgi:hypothetical protein